MSQLRVQLLALERLELSTLISVLASRHSISHLPCHQFHLVLRAVQFLEAPYVEKAGYTVVRDLDGFDQRRTKIIASRRLPRAPMDVAHMDDATAFELNALDALDKIDEAAVPRLKDVIPLLRTPTFVPWQYSA